MPTKQDAPLRIMRAAAMVIISSAVYFVSGMSLSGVNQRLFQAALEFIEILGAEDMLLHPGLERLALARDGVPLLVESVVARIIALRVGRKRSTLHFTHCADHPGWQHHRVGRCVQL